MDKEKIQVEGDNVAQTDNQQLDALDSLYRYYNDLQLFKKNFKASLKTFEPEDSFVDNIWGHWLIRNLNQEEVIVFPLPNPRLCEEDEDLYAYMLKRGCPDRETAKAIYSVHHKRLSEIYAAHSDFVRLFCTSEEVRIRFAQNFKNFDTRDKKESEQLKQLKENSYRYVELELCTFTVNKLKAIHSANEQLLNLDLFWVIFDHDILDFIRKQYCLPPSVMKLLHERLDVQTECMASPLNNFFRNYFSLFEADKNFRSYGSFFSRATNGLRLRGQCQINPPHVEAAYNLCGKRIVEFLEEAESANEELLFMQFLPWKDLEGYKIFESGAGKRFVFYETTVPANEHKEYVQSEQRFTRPLKCNTYIMAIGTTKSQNRWRGMMEDFGFLLKKHFKYPEDYKGEIYLV